MNKNNLIKKPKKGWIVLIMLFCGLFANTVTGQNTFTWNGSTNNDWATGANWTKTGVDPNADTFPGETLDRFADIVVINNGGTPVVAAPIVPGIVYGMLTLTITNAVSFESGSTLTINTDATLTVKNATTTVVTLNGGNIVNNGTLNVTSTANGASTGITCATPTQGPSSATEYGYSGSGILIINISTANVANSFAVAVTSLNANTTYKMLFNTVTTSITLSSSTFASYAIRAAGGIASSPLIIGGTGFTLGSGNGGLISLGGRSTVTVNSGTTLTMNSAATNATAGIASFTSGVAAAAPISFINKGTINILGTSSRSGVSFLIDNLGNSNFSPTVNVINFENQGNINVDMTITVASQAPLLVGTSGTGQGNVNILNTSTGNMNLKNNQAFAASIGSSIFVVTGGNVPNVNFTNNGSLNLTGTNVVFGGQSGTAVLPRSQFINTGTITSNNNFNLWTVSNSATGTIAFVNPASGASTSPFNGAFAVNNGKIQTATGSNSLTNLRGIAAYSATSSIEPGGAGYGIADLGVIGTTAPAGTLKLQVAGNTAGVDNDQLNITIGGVGYTSVPTVAFAGGAGSGATGYVNLSSGTITSVTMVSGGSGYTNGSAVTFSVGVGQTGTAVVSGGAITGVTLSGTKTTNYTANSNITFASAVTTSATATATLAADVVTGITFIGGAGYTSVPTVSFSASGSTTSAAVTATVSGGAVTGFNTVLSLSSLNLDIPFLYTPASNITIPIVTLSGLGATITGTFASVTGLKAGWELEYLSTVVNLKYTPGTTTAVNWNGATNSDWTNAGNWSAGVPTVSSNVTIPTASLNQPVIGSNVDINSITIESGKSLTVISGFNLTVTDAIANNGTLTIENNSNLIQVNNATNTGNIIVNRDSNALSRLDYTIWSSPVTGSQKLTDFSPNTSQSPSRFYNYVETSNLYSAITSLTSATFATATGYLIRIPNDHPTTPTVWNGSFSGVPNNGTINKAITYNGAPFGYNMVGNPYPSTIDAQAFITANTANIESSLYFWRKTNGASGSSYAIYNPMGSTIATPSSELPNGTIQVGQGFFVKAKSASIVTFTNAMRLANNANQFFKTKQVAQKDRVWLNLTNTSGVFSQALIGYTAAANSGVDMYDAKYINDSPIALTSNINDEEYSIQGRPAFDPSDVVTLNFKTDAAGEYTIAIDHADGLFATGQDVYLVDSKTGTETDLKVGAYIFTTAAGTDNARFSLKYQKTLKVDAPALNENSVRVYKNNGSLTVNSGNVAMSNIKVFDIQGRLIAEQKNVKATTAVFNNLKATHQVLIVKIAGEDNNVVTKKVVN